MSRRAGVGLILGRHRKRLANIISTLGQYFVFAALKFCTIILLMLSLYIRARMIKLFNYHFCVT